MTLSKNIFVPVTAIFACAVIYSACDSPHDSSPIRPAEITHVGGQDQIIVDARAGWVKTGIAVRSGEKIHFSATGSWGESPGETRSADGGQAGMFGSGYWGVERPLGSAPWGALIGRVGGSYFLIGTDNIVSMPQDGDLLLGINDSQGNNLNDNHGYVTVTIAR